MGDALEPEQRAGREERQDGDEIPRPDGPPAVPVVHEADGQVEAGARERDDDRLEAPSLPGDG